MHARPQALQLTPCLCMLPNPGTSVVLLCLPVRTACMPLCHPRKLWCCRLGGAPAPCCIVREPCKSQLQSLDQHRFTQGVSKKNFTTGAKAAARASCQAQLQLQATAASTGWCVVQPAHAATLVMAHACCFLPSSTACRPCPDSCTLDSAALQAPPPPQQRVCRVQPASPAAL